MSKIIKDTSTYEEVDMMGGEPYEKRDGLTTAVNFIEEQYPETAKEFKRLQNEQYELFCRKQMDYGPSNIAMGTDLTTNEQKRLSKIPTIDAFKDLACYGIIAQIVQNGKWGK